jgi:phosphatidylinositol-3-phosphatase
MKPATILLRIGTPLLVVTLCVQRAALSVKAATDVRVKHVYLVVLENHYYSSIIGNKSMPWLNGLASRYAYATAYYAQYSPLDWKLLSVDHGQDHHQQRRLQGHGNR